MLFSSCSLVRRKSVLSGRESPVSVDLFDVFSPNFVEDRMSDLTHVDSLVKSLKGGGSKNDTEPQVST